MVDKQADTIWDAVSVAYGARARDVASGGRANCCGDAVTEARATFYKKEETSDLPESVVSYGCGNPLGIAELRAGEIVLDLGSGAGLDCFLAAERVGANGRVIGLDMTDDMLALAERNKAQLGVTNVEFRKGMIEALPVADGSVDVIISNCVINLSPDKDAVLAEAFRALRPGGRVSISDVVLLGQLSESEQSDMELWAGCVSGALERGDYAAKLARAGFGQISIEIQPTDGAGAAEKAWRSALITASKAGAATAARARLGEQLELIAPEGLETGACCADGSCTI